MMSMQQWVVELQSQLDELSMKMGVDKVLVKPLVVEGPNLAMQEPKLEDVDGKLPGHF